VAFLLPVSRNKIIARRIRKYVQAVIYVTREVKQRICHKVNFKKVRNVKREPKQIKYLSEEYFNILKEQLPIIEFYCHLLKGIATVEYCLLCCRWSYKSKCPVFLGGLWGCLACNSFIDGTCLDRKECGFYRYYINLFSMYFSELIKNKSYLSMMAYGHGFVDNAKGYGPQIYLNIRSPQRRKAKAITLGISYFKFIKFLKKSEIGKKRIKRKKRRRKRRKNNK